MTDTRSYEDGFKDGWRSIRGIVILPMYVRRMTRRLGQTDYEAGYAHGVEKAEKSLNKG